MRLEKTVEEMVEYIREKKSNTPNFKWTSVNGKALDDALLMIDREFLDRLLLNVERREANIINIERHLGYREKELEEREKKIVEREATISYPFENPKYRDTYLMATALRKEFTGARNGCDAQVAIRIIEMVEKFIKEDVGNGK